MQGMFEGGFQGEKRHQLGNQTQRAIGYPSLLSKEAGRYNGRRNADKLIPGEVLPPCVETESRFLIKNGVLMQYLGHEEEVTIPDTCTALEQIELTKGLKKSGGTRFPKRLSPISICPTV